MPRLSTRTLTPLAPVGLLVFLGSVGLPAPASAQIGSTMRGEVRDTEGNPVPDVNIEFVFKGESRVPIVKKAKTDKKGGYVRVGLQSGNWDVTFTKEGYKPHGIETWLSGDALSEVPPIVLEKAPVGQATPTSVAEIDEAAAERKKAEELGKTYAAALDALNAGNNAEAEELFEAVLAENPAVAPAYYNLGYLAMLRDDGAAAEAQFRKAIEVAPETSDSYVALATLMTAQGKGEEALALLEGRAEAFAADGIFQYGLGVAASNVGNEALARTAFEKAAELQPENVESQYYLGTLAMNRSDLPAAIAHLEAYVAGAGEGAPNLPTAKALLDALKKQK